jgi:hypothetical protein
MAISNNFNTYGDASFNSRIFAGSDVSLGGRLFANGNIYTNGSVIAAGTTLTSDYRVKDNVLDLDATYKVDNLRPVSYYNTLLNKNDIGFIAHEIQESYPQLVSGIKDGAEYQSMNYIGLIGILTKEIKDLKAELARNKSTPFVTIPDTSSNYVLDYSLGSTFYLTNPPESNFSTNIINVPNDVNQIYDTNLIITSKTNKSFCESVQINGNVIIRPNFANGIPNIISGNYISQKISIQRMGALETIENFNIKTIVTPWY